MPQVSSPPKGCGRSRRGRSRGLALLLLVALLLGGDGADAAPAGWPEAEYNPAPLADDVVLPMPCGGAMAFRKVVIPSLGPLSDQLITLGGADSERGYAEGARPSYIAGSFGELEGERHYLIGKYEVSALQYRSLTTPCPRPDADARLPQVDIGWIDAVAFADRYSLWMRANAADKLPKDGAEPAFLRLPTEAEWEFAARGGIKVSPSDFREPVFPMLDGGLPAYVWFAGTASSNNKIQRIGLLKTNPLGLHDILGNVDEMALEPFRLNKLDRLHGQAGGFVVRGGNYTTAEADVRAAYRHEVPLYKGPEARRAKTTGFRLVAVSPVIVSRDRLQSIEESWAELGAEADPAASASPVEAGASAAAPAGAPVQLSDRPLADPVQELGAIAAAAPDPAMQKRLKDLQLTFRASFQARDEQAGRAVKARLRLGTFLCQKLKDDGDPLDRYRGMLKACIEARGAEHERCQAQKSLVESEELKEYENLQYYADTIVTLVDDYSKAEVESQQGVLKSELNARGLQALLPVSDIYVGHVQDYRSNGVLNRAGWLKRCKER